MADQEINICDTCKQVKPVSRKYYYYNIKCECHNNNHFEIVWHCKDCEPIEPVFTKIEMKTSNLPKIEL